MAYKHIYAYSYHSKCANIWTRTIHAVRRTHLSIDVSNQKNISMTIDDICTAPAKAVKSLRLILRNLSSKKLLDYPVQGCIARSQNKLTEHKIITKLLSQRSSLSLVLGLIGICLVYKSFL